MAGELVLDAPLQSQKSLVWWLYVFHALSLVFSLGLFSFIPLIINYVKRGDADGTFVRSHHSWQIRSFWWYLVWMALGVIFFFTFFLIPLGWLVCTVAWVWKAYRLIRGFINLNDNKAMPA
ncbi:MAG: hypothetical protein JWP38_1202 [Herbaspirillum sp.]|jgi:uncharacterized membrane protein|nr:hypothetical protein [Herbaspirillum sp.]